ncbi:hypothetical protein REPUB_Repub02eG0078200 [Reevesia pubescens]
MRATSSEDMKYGANDASGAQGFRYTYGTNFSDSFSKIFSEIFEHEMDRFLPDIQSCCSLFLKLLKDAQRIYVLMHLFLVILVFTIPPFTSTRNTCKGSGRITKDYCRSCQGSGVVEGVKEVKVTIPAGVDSGDTICVPEAVNIRQQGSQPGNLFIRIKVADDPIFARDGADVYVNSNISFTQAILGGTVEVPMLSGKIQVNVLNG